MQIYEDLSVRWVARVFVGRELACSSLRSTSPQSHSARPSTSSPLSLQRQVPAQVGFSRFAKFNASLPLTTTILPSFHSPANVKYPHVASSQLAPSTTTLTHLPPLFLHHLAPPAAVLGKSHCSPTHHARRVEHTTNIGFSRCDAHLTTTW